MPLKYTDEENASRLSAIIETAIDGIILINDRGVIEAANPAACRLFQYDEEEMLGHNVSMLMPEPYKSMHDKYIRHYSDTGEGKIIGIGREVPGRKKNGETFPFRLAISEIILTDDRRLFTGIIHDLTEQKEAEAKLVAQTEELEARVKERTAELSEAKAEVEQALEKERELGVLKSRFVSMASHEFRTPLSTILSSVTLIDRYEDKVYLEKRKKHISRIKASVRNLTAILNDFLSMGKLEEGRIQHRPHPFRLKPFLDGLHDEMQHLTKTDQRIAVRYEGEDQEIVMDDHILKNILHNLLSNAIKYSGEGDTIEFTVKLSADSLAMSISDQGIGIPKEEQGHLFERFFRAHNATNIQGTGLGLSIVKQYVELMRGNITFESEVGKGTTFNLAFPRLPLDEYIGETNYEKNTAHRG
jgi:PAS domain S-box-containing protein